MVLKGKNQSAYINGKRVASVELPGDVEYMHGQGSGMYYPNYLMYEHEHMGWYGHVEHDGIPGGETAVAGLGVNNALASHDGAWVSVC